MQPQPPEPIQQPPMQQQPEPLPAMSPAPEQPQKFARHGSDDVLLRKLETLEETVRMALSEAMSMALNEARTEQLGPFA